MHFSAISMKITGKAFCSWSTGGAEDSDDYAGQEYYLNEKFSFLADHGPSTVMPVGVYSYPFQFALPKGIPTSVRGSNGYIRYCAKAKIEMSGISRDLKTQEEFTIVKQLSLDDMPDLKVCMSKLA